MQRVQNYALLLINSSFFKLESLINEIKLFLKMSLESKMKNHRNIRGPL